MKPDEPDQPVEGEMRVSDWLGSQKPSPNKPAPTHDRRSEGLSLAETMNAKTPQPSIPPLPGKQNRDVLKAPILEPLRRESPMASLKPSIFQGHTPVQIPVQNPEPAPISPYSAQDEEPPSERLPFDPMRYVGGIFQRKLAILFVALVGLGFGFCFGWLSGNDFRASATIILRDVPSGNKTKEMTIATLGEILTSQVLLQRVGPKLHPPMTAKKLFRNLEMKPGGRGGECLVLTFKGAPSDDAAVQGVNTWAKEALLFTKEMQSKESRDERLYLDRQKLQDAIHALRSEIASLRARYSDQNPLVRERLAQLKALEDQLNLSDDPSNSSSSVDSATQLDISENATLGYFDIMSPGTLEAVKSKNRWVKGMIFGVITMIVGFIGMIGMAFMKEVLDRRVRTATELELSVNETNLQKVPRISPRALAANEVSTIWTRIVGAAPDELTCFWTPYYHEQPSLVMQALLNVATKQAVPLIWVDTGMYGVRAPADFKEVTLQRLGQELGTGRYFLKLNLQTLSSMEAEQVGQALRDVAEHQKVPVWVGIQGQIHEPACSVARPAHRVKILAALDAMPKGFWQNESDLLKQSVGSNVEWLAVNHVPWYRW